MMNKRPCVILAADSNMAATFRGYFKRERWHLSLGCAPFEINTDVGADLLVDEGGNDPGVYTKGHELLRPYVFRTPFRRSRACCDISSIRNFKQPFGMQSTPADNRIACW